MNEEEKIKLFNDVFAPKPGENILFLVDKPHGQISDNKKWKERREMAKDWYETFDNLGKNIGFSVKFLNYKATGAQNRILSDEINDEINKSNLVIAMTEFSATSTIMPICNKKNSKTRGASMPMVEKRMETTAFKANYQDVKKYAYAIKKFLNNANKAKVSFSTGDELFIDLRNRVGCVDAGDCTKYGQGINFPSGEGFIAPYESYKDEIKEYGRSQTEGILPVKYGKELVKYIIKNNKIIDAIGDGQKAEEMKKFFKENNSRRNIAELGIGCNPKAIVTGNILEDEKVGLHIAYGMSSHIGGKIESDLHQDIVYAKGCPVEGITLTLFNKDGSKTDLIKNSMLRYKLLQ